MLEWFRIHTGLKILQLVAFLAVLAFPLGCEVTLPQSAPDGEGIFQQKCASCHTIGAGDLVGPDLKGVTKQRDPQWLAGFIAEPDRVLDSGDSIAASLRKQYGNVAMPNLGLSHEQVAAVITYLNDPSLQQTSPTRVLPVGDAAKGRALFMGNVHFQNGGPPCMGCHNIGSNGLLGGGALGPDLTDVSTRYSDTGLEADMANIPWPTMQSIFSKHPLIPEEQADLVAFMNASTGQRATDKELLVIAVSLAGFIAAVVFIGIVYRRRLRGVRRPLVERIQSGK
jgi:mono/diheme cytochrome c family protein